MQFAAMLLHRSSCRDRGKKKSRRVVFLLRMRATKKGVGSLRIILRMEAGMRGVTEAHQQIRVPTMGRGSRVPNSLRKGTRPIRKGR
jgi:hypothetical protein